MSLEKKIGVRVTAKTDQAASELDKLGGAADRAAERVKKMGRAAPEVKKAAFSFEKMASTGAMAFGVLAGGIYTMDKVITSQMRYNALLRNAPFSIQAATNATKGFISQTVLLESAIAANRSGVAKSGAQFAQFAGDVQKLAMTTGQDPAEAMDVLTKALAKSEAKLLDNYNIILKVEQAHEIYAKRLGKTANELTAEEKASAFAQIGMEKIHEAAAKGNVQLEVHEAMWLRVKAALSDFPKMMTDASNGITDFFSNLDHWQNVTGMTLRGESLLVGDNRRGLGFKGAGGIMDKKWAEFFTENDKMTPELVEWKKRWDAYGTNAAETGHEAMMSALEAAWKAKFSGKGGKGKKAKFAWAKDLHNQMVMAGAGMDRETGDTRDYAAGLRDTRDGSIMREANERRINEAAEYEMRKAEAVLEARQMGLEMAEAQGLSPAALADAELQAQETLLEAKERYIAATMKGTERLMALEDLQSERRKAHHNAEMAHLKIEMKARDTQKKRMEAIGDSVVDVHAGVAAAAIAGAFAADQSVKASVASFAKAKGIEMTILAATEAIKAVASAASFNFVGAQAHATAAAMAAGEAGVLLALAGATGGFSRGSSAGSGRSAGPSSGGRPTTSHEQRNSNHGAPPISHTNSGPHKPGAPQPHGPGPSVNVTYYTMFPPDKDQQLIHLRRALAVSERDNPKV